MINKIVLTTIIALFLFSPVEIGINGDSKLKSELQAKLDSLALDPDIPGISVAIVFPDNQVIHITSGMADREKTIKILNENSKSLNYY
jgi:hypothetical protein